MLSQTRVIKNQRADPKLYLRRTSLSPGAATLIRRHLDEPAGRRLASLDKSWLKPGGRCGPRGCLSCLKTPLRASMWPSHSASQWEALVRHPSNHCRILPEGTPREEVTKRAEHKRGGKVLPLCAGLFLCFLVRGCFLLLLCRSWRCLLRHLSGEPEDHGSIPPPVAITFWFWG